MPKNNPRRSESLRGLLRSVEMFLEIVALTAVYYCVWSTYYDVSYFQEKGIMVLLGLYAFIMLTLFQSSDCANFSQLRCTDLITGQAIALFLTNCITYCQLCLIGSLLLNPMPILLLYCIQFIISVVLVIFFTSLYYKLYAPRDLLLIYGDPRGARLKAKIDSRHDKYNITQLISADVGFDALCREIANHDAIILCDVSAELRNNILKYCYHNRVRVYISPKLTDIVLRGAKNITLFDTPLLLVKSGGLNVYQRIMKRAMDLILGVLVLVVITPVMAIIAVAIKLEDGGPVFYSQERLTLDGKEFQMLKFRSMIPDAEKYTGAILAAEQDPRITRVGRFIRATRLDELPQIVNILKGEMSIVGPRPERKSIAEEYSKEIPEFAYRLKVKGGLTGYAQVYGKYNSTPYDKLRLDLMYVENYSLLLDIKLIILTLRVIFSKESTEGVEVTDKHAQNVGETQHNG